jgi:diguanylate cyclase (GGDEF)-like protein
MLDPSELARLEVLRGVDMVSLEHHLEGCDVRTLEPGDVLLTMGQPNEVMYMILAGRLSVHLEGGPTTDPVAYLDAGGTVGELSVLDARPASAHVVAATRSRVLAVDGKAFWALVDASHDFSINLLVLLAGRLRANNATVSDNIRLQREYKRNAMVDALTGLFNRRWLEEALPRFVNRYVRSGDALTLLMIDVDHFKRFNDTHGHPAGDAALVAVAHTLRSGLRPTDHVARYGGEEFAAILPDTAARAALGVAERLRAAVGLAPIRGQDGRLLPNVTISIGAAVLGPERNTAAALLAAADGALYASKQQGRDRVTL